MILAMKAKTQKNCDLGLHFFLFLIALWSGKGVLVMKYINTIRF